MDILAVGLATMKCLDIVKEITIWPSWVRHVLALLLSTGFSLFFHRSGSGTVILAGAGAGAAALLHEVASVLSMASDQRKQEIILRAGHRRSF